MVDNLYQVSDKAKPVLVFGRNGQVGRALQRCFSNLDVPVVFLGRAECDLANEDEIIKTLNLYQPQVIINAAAYTGVDNAESERELAFAINAKGPAVMAHYMVNVAHGILVHYSTDYVFADTKQTSYLETDIAGPLDQLSVYGQSKLAGEEAIKKTFNLAHDSGDGKYQENFSRYFILRTSWVYGDGENFIQKILRLAGEQTQLKIVNDQIGVSTSAQWLAEMSVKMIDSNIESGIYHVVPDGETSWYELARFVIETASRSSEGIDIKLTNILPVATVDYSMLAKRPHNSRLNNVKFKKALSKIAFVEQYPQWQEQVKAYVKESVTTPPRAGEVDGIYVCQ
ncbi:dTDP-4-dehydrorhamnose reductase [Polynucleobacter sp. MWH-CaK5]|uniref:dTDP-4-dehydrorhamnose reductase n=1 Tax=Polynucleobacter sp. MWH-CaK5 TaxID=2689107 RepID=UPI001BFCF622|nr:dTDP-4-dehydrorhamnose reductase [Polynucleobacter sp. MWH-CaK5]QWD89151.1 dTDP-4-dehydrorhamnose reductase [Polynucleobacter sp. MWH-CaK5]